MNCFQSWGHFSSGAGAKAPCPPPRPWIRPRCVITGESFAEVRGKGPFINYGLGEVRELEGGTEIFGVLILFVKKGEEGSISYDYFVHKEKR